MMAVALQSTVKTNLFVCTNTTLDRRIGGNTTRMANLISVVRGLDNYEVMSVMHRYLPSGGVVVAKTCRQFMCLTVEGCRIQIKQHQIAESV